LRTARNIKPQTSAVNQ